MRDILPVVVDGLWRQRENLAVRLVSAEGNRCGVDARRPYRSPLFPAG